VDVRRLSAKTAESESVLQVDAAREKAATRFLLGALIIRAVETATFEESDDVG
jgi:hypothetical protein